MEGAKRHCVMIALREGYLGDMRWLWFEVAVQVCLMWGVWEVEQRTLFIVVECWLRLGGGVGCLGGSNTVLWGERIAMGCCLWF